MLPFKEHIAPAFNTCEQEDVMSDNTPKRSYTTPELKLHGTLEDLTQLNKNFGTTDALIFNGGDRIES